MADLLHPCSLICSTGRSKFEQTIVTLLAAAALCGVFTGRQVLLLQGGKGATGAILQWLRCAACSQVGQHCCSTGPRVRLLGSQAGRCCSCTKSRGAHVQPLSGCAVERIRG